MMTIKALIITVAAQHGIDPQIALSVAFVESGFKQEAVSPSGDYGIFQLNVKYFPNAPEMTVDENIRVGIKHLAWTKKHCKLNQERIMEIGPVPSLPDMKYLYVNCYNMGVTGAAKLLKPWDYGYFQRVMEQYGKH